MHKNHIVGDYLNGATENIDERSSSTMKLERFCDRLSAAKGAETAASLSKRTGINESLISKYLSGSSMPLLDRAAELANALNVDLTWLATGEREMRVGQAQQKQSTAIKSTVIEQPRDDEWQDFYLVPFYDVEVSAGHGSNVESEQMISQIAFRKNWLQEKGVEAKYLITIKAKGTSMEPTISDGDILLVNTSIDKIIDDSIYIVRADQHLIVKRIQQNLNGSLRIISDNKIYNDQLIPSEEASEIKIAGRVIWYGHEI